MFQGGIFLYPNTRKYPKGKLRLLYECYPMAYLIEQAGGTAITCKLERVLDMEVKSIHQTSSIAMGSEGMVKDMKEFVEKYGAVL